MAFLGGAAISGPAMAKQAVVGLEAMTLPSIASTGMFLADASLGSTGAYAPSMSKEYDHGNWLRERLAELCGLSDADKRDRLYGRAVSALDPDLAVNRSFSLAAKVEMQKRRDLDRSLEYEKRQLTRELANWLKNQALYSKTKPFISNPSQSSHANHIPKGKE